MVCICRTEIVDSVPVGQEGHVVIHLQPGCARHASVLEVIGHPVWEWVRFGGPPYALSAELVGAITKAAGKDPEGAC
jgi:hypothetical protein